MYSEFFTKLLSLIIDVCHKHREGDAESSDLLNEFPMDLAINVYDLFVKNYDLNPKK